MSISSYQTTFRFEHVPAASSTVLERLTGLHPKSIDLSLGRTERLLAALGHPDRRLPPVIHVAGTNGKGSVIAFLRAISESAARRVHAYTSPHLVRFHERIVLAGEEGSAPISEEYLVECLQRVEEANAGEEITHFEITTAAAFLAFSEVNADVLLLETGLGGRLDATNVLDAPEVTVITPISIDHVAYLGSTLPAIAAEKAGILKPGVPCVVGRQDAAALAVIAERARAIGAPLHVFGRDFDVFERSGRLMFRSETTVINAPLPCLAGQHQIENAGLAIAAAGLLFGDTLKVDAIDRGMRDAHWPARFQHLRDGALNDCVGMDTELLLDGGHNPSGGRAAAKALSDLNDCDPREVHLIWGMMEAKDAKAVIAPFKGLATRVYSVPIPDEANAFSADALAAIAGDEGFDVLPAKGLIHALLLSRAAVAGPGRVLIFGSLYLAGHVLKLHGNPG